MLLLTRSIAGFISLFLGLSSFLSSEAHAYRISDHRQITRVAVSRLRQCFPVEMKRLSDSDVDAIVKADVEEDLDLIRKWTHYSHYYNPFKTLNMERADSMVTIVEVEKSLVRQSYAETSTPYSLLGRAIHHLQDATVPPHVVPVDHSLTDGFERFEVKPVTETDCGAFEWVQRDPSLFLEKDTLSKALFQTAIQTYQDLSLGIQVQKSGQALKTQWAQAFWTPSSDASFGRYGALGNHFGQSRFEQDSVTWDVPAEAYTEFKLRRMEAAIQVTERALLWFLSLGKL